MLTPGLSFADVAASSANFNGAAGHEADYFDLPVNNPMALDKRALEVTNTFCSAFRTAQRMGGCEAGHFEAALEKTLIEHSFPKQPDFSRRDVMETLVDAGLKMPSYALPSDLKDFGSDVRPEERRSVESKTQFDASDLLVAQCLLFESEKSRERDRAPRKEPEALRRQEELLERQRQEMRDYRARQMGAPRPSMPGGHAVSGS